MEQFQSTWAPLLYLAAGILFILALRGLSHPESSRRGNQYGMVGMAIAVLTTLFGHPPVGSGWLLLIVGIGIGGAVGATREARRAARLRKSRLARRSRKSTIFQRKNIWSRNTGAMWAVLHTADEKNGLPRGCCCSMKQKS